MKIIEEEMKKQITDQQSKTKSVALDNNKKLAVKKINKEIDISYKPDLKPKVIREDGNLDKGEMEKRAMFMLKKLERN
jgi:hypothetical protein